MYTKKPFLNFFFENVTFRVTTEFPTHSIQRHCCQLLLVTLTTWLQWHQKMPKFQKLLKHPKHHQEFVLALSRKLNWPKKLQNLQDIQDFFQTNGGEENVFNSIGNLEKVSLALSLQAKNSHQSRLTDYFTPK